MTRRTSSGFFARVKRMCTRFPVRDISYLTAVFFWFGASFFAINGFFYILETTQPQTDFATETNVAIPVTRRLGDFFFFLGCTTAVLQALNIGRGGINGTVPENSSSAQPARVPKLSAHVGGKEPWPVAESVRNEKNHGDLERAVSTSTAVEVVAKIGGPGWIWYPTMTQLRQYYIRDIAFVASVISWTGIVFFTIATIVYIPGVADLYDMPTYYYAALLQTFLGGTFFFIAAAMQTIFLAQEKWYIPAPHRLAWHAGFFNSVGSIGFALGGALWYGGESYYWSATLAEFWGAWGWWVGSTIAWYIIMDEYP